MEGCWVSTAIPYPSFLLVLSVKKCVVAEFKETFPVLQVAGDGRAMTSLEQPAVVQDEVMDVATVFQARLLCH